MSRGSASTVCERSPPELTEHARLGPLAGGSSRPELAFEETSLGRESHEDRVDDRRGQPVPRCDLERRERRVRAGEAGDEIGERVGCRRQQRFRETRRQRDAQGVAVICGVFDRDMAGLAGDADRHGPPCGNERPNGVGSVSYSISALAISFNTARFITRIWRVRSLASETMRCTSWSIWRATSSP